MSGRSGFSGLWTTRISSSGGDMWRARAWAIIDFPVPGGPTSRKCRRCSAASRASSTASTWPITRASGSAGITTSAAVSISSRVNPSAMPTSFSLAMANPSRGDQIDFRVHVHGRRLIRDGPHLHSNDALHTDFRGDIENPLCDDAVEYNGPCLTVRPEGLDEGPDRDLCGNAVVLGEDPCLRRAANFKEHVPVLFELRVHWLRSASGGDGRRAWGGRGRRFRGERPVLLANFGTGLWPLAPLLARRMFWPLLLGPVDLTGEARHLDVLIRGNLVPEGLHDLLLRQLFNLSAPRGPRDEVDFCNLQQLAQDQVATPVAIDERGDDFLLR